MIVQESNAISWETDYRDRINPQLVTRLLRKSVPALEACDWRVSKVDYGLVESVLPLNQATTNQHGTHQAALISLSADYTGGTALASLLSGVPMAGVHPCKPVNSASLWLAAMDVKYLRPSTGHLTGRCRIEEKTANNIVYRYSRGKRVLASLNVSFESNGETVAEGVLKYFAQPTIQLLDNTSNRSLLFRQKIKASARMIAGVRAGQDLNWNRNSEPGQRLRIDCPHAVIAAGPHGQLLAARLRKALPQLTDMVVARTQHIDNTIRNTPGLRQLVLVGAGLDMRAFRHAIRRPEIKCFEMDLPEMLEERDRVIQEIDPQGSLDRYCLALDFLQDDPAQALANCPEFDPALPTVFVYEGCSMYFEEQVNRKIIQSLMQMMQHPQSRLWIDFVTQQSVEGRTQVPEIADFLTRMDDLGESFIFGSDQPDQFLKTCGVPACDMVRSGDYLDTIRDDLQIDPVYQVYYFTVSHRGEADTIRKLPR
ncbi:MAG: SAM-dependent methyltransferase [Mariniblastus sp.]|nr:SAM-dependent methyltransferase [Mariniblastus sp.]